MPRSHFPRSYCGSAVVPLPLTACVLQSARRTPRVYVRMCSAAVRLLHSECNYAVGARPFTTCSSPALWLAALDLCSSDPADWPRSLRAKAAGLRARKVGALSTRACSKLAPRSSQGGDSHRTLTLLPANLMPDHPLCSTCFRFTLTHRLLSSTKYSRTFITTIVSTLLTFVR